MTTQEIHSNQWYINVIEYASSTLKLSLSQIQKKYSEYHLCIMDYITKDIHEKSIEIQFDKEEVTLTCTFNEDGNCVSSFLFLDDEECIEEFVGYLTENHDYNFVRSRFVLGSCFLEVKELKGLRENLCLVFYQ